MSAPSRLCTFPECDCDPYLSCKADKAALSEKRDTPTPECDALESLAAGFEQYRLLARRLERELALCHAGAASLLEELAALKQPAAEAAREEDAIQFAAKLVTLKHLKDEAVLAERGACARLCEDFSENYRGRDCANAIRARSGTVK